MVSPPHFDRLRQMGVKHFTGEAKNRQRHPAEQGPEICRAVIILPDKRPPDKIVLIILDSLLPGPESKFEPPQTFVGKRCRRRSGHGERRPPRPAVYPPSVQLRQTRGPAPIHTGRCSQKTGAVEAVVRDAAASRSAARKRCESSPNSCRIRLEPLS